MDVAVIILIYLGKRTGYNPQYPRLLSRALDNHLISIRVGHGIDPCTTIFHASSDLLCSHTTLGHIQAILHGFTLFNMFHPSIQGWPFGNVNLQSSRGSVNTGKMCNVSDSVLVTCQIRTILKTGVQNRIEAFGFIDIALDSIVGSNVSEDTEVVCLAYIMIWQVS
jgi:hypothetical protein